MSDIFFSYKREDRARVAPLVAALRAAGLDTWWDQDIPAGGSWRETIAQRLAQTRLCVVAWSDGSVGEGGRYVREEAEHAASRGAYLGVLLDPVVPPFGFGEWQAIDLSGFDGDADDTRLPWFVDQVRARLEGAPFLGPAPPVISRKVAKRAPVVALAAVAALLVASGGYYLSGRGTTAAPPTPTSFVNARLAAAECSWVQIANVRPGDDGERIALSGTAAAPDALQAALLREADAAGVALDAVDIAEVATAPQQVCAELELIRPYRWDDRSRLTLIPPRGALTQTEHGWSGRFEFELDYSALPQHAALLGLDTLGGLKVLLPDVHVFRREHAPLRENGTVATYEGYFFDDNQDARNVGLILLTADRPIDAVLVEQIGNVSDRAGLRGIDAAAREAGWRFELALVRCGFEAGETRQC